MQEWCDWVEREARTILQQVTTATLDAAAEADIEQLSEALNALSAKWRGDNATAPPQPPEPPAAAKPDPAVAARAELAALTTRARPRARVTTRPYDEQLYDDLVSLLPFAATLPPTPGNLGNDLVGVAEPAAAVARNAEDDLLVTRINEASRLEPLAAAVALLSSLKAVATETGRACAANQAADLAARRLAAHSWSGEAAWDANLLHCKELLAMTATQTSIDKVRTAVSTALPSITPGHLLIAIALARTVRESRLSRPGPTRTLHRTATGVAATRGP